MPNWRRLWIAIALLLLSGLISLPAAGQSGGGLDLVLLIDSTGSTADTDPGALRVGAAKYLLDYVQAVGEVQGVTHRFAAANFNTTVQDEIPWTLLQGNAGRAQLVARSVGGTDFKPALEHALRLRQESGGAAKMAVVLFTDGAPCPTTPCLQGTDLDNYFQGLEPAVTALMDTGAEVFVVALGDNSTAAQWGNLVGTDHYRFVDANTDLAGIYHDFFAWLLGLGADAVRSLKTGGSTAYTVEPYLEQLIISVVKTDRRALVTVNNPFGGTVTPMRGGADEYHAVYAVSSPTAGTWRVSVAGGAAQVYVDRQYATLALDALTAPQALGTPIQVTGQLFRRGSVIRDDPDLHLSVRATGPGNSGATLDLTRKSEGRYLGALTGLTAEGVYTLTLSGEWSGQPVGARQMDVVTASLFATPQLGVLDLQGDQIIGAPLTVTVAISNADRIGPETEMSARLLRADGSTVDAPLLRDDGKAPDAVAGDGIYAATLVLSAAEANYLVEVVLSGKSRDGVALDAVTPQRAVYAQSEAMPTPTVTPPPPSTLEEEYNHLQEKYNQLSSRFVGSIILLLVGGALLAGYLGYQLSKQRSDLGKVSKRLAAEIAKTETTTATLASTRATLESQIARADEETAQKKIAEASFDMQCELTSHAEARAEKAEQELKYAKAGTIWEQVDSLIQRLAQTTDISTARTLTDELVKMIEGSLRATSELAYNKTQIALVSLFSKLRQDTNQYREAIVHYANSPHFETVRAVAYALLKEKGQEREQERDPWEVIQDFYYTVSSTPPPLTEPSDSVGEPTSFALLKALSSLTSRNGITSLSLCLYEVCTGPKPDYRSVIETARSILGIENSKGIIETYQCLQKLEQQPLEMGSETMWDIASKASRTIGPQALADLLTATRHCFFGEDLRVDIQNGEWPKAAQQLDANVRRLCALTEDKQIPEVELLVRILRQWRDYAQGYAQEALQTAEAELGIEFGISLDLDAGEEILTPDGAWRFELPIMVRNSGDVASRPIRISVTSIDPKNDRLLKDELIEFSPILPYSAICRFLRPLTIRTPLTLALGPHSDSKSMLPGALNLLLPKLVEPEKNQLDDPLEARIQRLWENIQEDLQLGEQVLGLRGLPGSGRSTLQSEIAKRIDPQQYIVGEINLCDLPLTQLEPEQVAAEVWRLILKALESQTTVSSDLWRDRPLVQSQFETIMREIKDKDLKKRRFFIIVKGTHMLAHPKFGDCDRPASYEQRASLGLELIPKLLGGVLWLTLDSIPQPWEHLLYGKFVTPAVRSTLALNPEQTKALVCHYISRPLSELALQTLWVYSGGHPGFIKLVGEETMRSHDESIPICGSEMKEIVRNVLDLAEVRSWFVAFGLNERRLLDTLAGDDGFTQPETGLLYGLYRSPKSEGDWEGIDVLLATLMKNGDIPNRAEVTSNLENLLRRQILEFKDRNTPSWAICWRLGWVYALAREQSPEINPFDYIEASRDEIVF